METTERPRSLCRSVNDRVLAGVAGGLAPYLGVDTVWVRLGFVLTSLVWGLGVMVYALLWITLPEESLSEDEEVLPPLATRDPRSMVGIILLGLGVLLLVKGVLDLLTWRVVLPVLLIGVGLFLLGRRSSS